MKRLKLLPDRAGSVILLRTFGEVVFWREIESLWIAAPWLIYAELMSSEDPRAHDAGERMRQELLTQR